MNRFKRSWGSSRKGDSATEPTDDAFNSSEKTDASGGTPPAEQSRASVEAHLRQFEMIHEFDPNLPGINSQKYVPVKLLTSNQRRNVIQ
jgi:hypothetical protein